MYVPPRATALPTVPRPTAPPTGAVFGRVGVRVIDTGKLGGITGLLVRILRAGTERDAAATPTHRLVLIERGRTEAAAWLRQHADRQWQDEVLGLVVHLALPLLLLGALGLLGRLATFPAASSSSWRLYFGSGGPPVHEPG